MSSSTIAQAISLLAVARHLREQYGFSVIPITHTSKIPALTRWRAYQQRPPRDEELRAWFSTSLLHVGIVCGAVSGIVVIDGDDDEARQWARDHLPATAMRAITPRGGDHWYYRHPGGVVPNRVRVHPACAPHPLALDVRGDGGYVRYYGEAEPWPKSIDAVPVCDPAWLGTRPMPTALPRPAVASEVPMVERARAYVARLPIPVIGAGSDAAVFYAACRLVRGFDLSEADALAVLWEWCGDRPGWTRGWVATKVAHAERHGREPLGGLR